MKFSKVVVTAAGFLFFCLFSYTASAQDCPGAPYAGSGTCQSAGLDTHRGVCKNNHFFPYETLCDDDSRGYKICRGPKKCGGPPGAALGGGCDWDFNTGRPCPPGYYNRDCSGGCGKL